MIKIRTNSSLDKPNEGLSKYKLNFILRIIQMLRNPVCFEYGCGISTLFFLKYHQIARWIAVENDKGWFEFLQNRIIDPRFSIIFCPPTTIKDKEEWWRMENKDPWENSIFFYDYINSIKDHKPDFVLIDGRARIACLSAAYNYTSDNSIVVMDDAHRVKRSLTAWEPVISLWPFAKYIPHKKNVKRESLYVFSKKAINL